MSYKYSAENSKGYYHKTTFSLVVVVLVIGACGHFLEIDNGNVVSVWCHFLDIDNIYVVIVGHDITNRVLPLDTNFKVTEHDAITVLNMTLKVGHISKVDGTLGTHKAPLRFDVSSFGYFSLEPLVAGRVGGADHRILDNVARSRRIR